MKFLNSITSWLDLQVGFSKKSQRCLTIERLGSQPASVGYYCLAGDVIPELKSGKPTISGNYYLFEVWESGVLSRFDEARYYDANIGLWRGSQNSTIPPFTHYIPISEYNSVMEKSVENAKARVGNEMQEVKR
ncbi:MAG: hypothetical protein V3U87_12065 [Methylococcaceae bacterium]